MKPFELGEDETPDISAIEGLYSDLGEDGLLPEELELYKQYHPDQTAQGGNSDHYANLVDQIDSTVAKRLASDIIQWVETDITSRTDWERREARGIKLLGVSEKTEGGATFEGSSKVVHPLLCEAVNQFHSRALVEMWPPEGPVKTRVLGEQTPERSAQAERVMDYMNYLYTVQMPGAFEEEDKLLFRLPISGSVFKKSYYCPLEETIMSVMVEPSDFIVPYQATNLRTAPRFTHRVEMSHNDVLRHIKQGYYADVSLTESYSEISDDNEVRQGIDAVEGRANTLNEYGASRVLYEMYLDYDLPGFEDVGDDGEPTGIGLPYIVTVDKDQQTILRIQRNWKPDDPKCKKRIYFTHYRFSPGLGFYGYGLLHLIGGLSESATGTLRALMDAAAFANLQGGFKTRDAKIKGGDTPIAPGEWRETDSSFEELSKGFFRIPYVEPSDTMFKLLGYLDERGQRFASTTENMVGEANNSAPVGTTLALIEQGSKAFTAIHKRLHQAHDQEFKLVGELCAEYMPDGGYPYFSAKSDALIMAQDFDARIDIIPVSDPAIISSTQRIAQAQSILDLAEKFPDRINVEKAIERMLIAMRIPDYEELIMSQQANPMADALQQLQVEELSAKVDKIKAEATVKNIEGQFSAVQAAQTIAMTPAITPIADELLLSAGYQDANGAPLATQPAAPMMPEQPMPQNTDPRFPANTTSPATGMMKGIETQEMDSTLPTHNA